MTRVVSYFVWNRKPFYTFGWVLGKDWRLAVYIKKQTLKTISVCYRKGEQESDLVPALDDWYQRRQAKARAESRYITQQQNNRVKGVFLFPMTGNVPTVVCVCFLTRAYECKILYCKYCMKFLFNDWLSSVAEKNNKNTIKTVFGTSVFLYSMLSTFLRGVIENFFLQLFHTLFVWCDDFLVPAGA